MWLTVTSPPQSRMWAQGHWWAVFSLRSVNDVPKIGSNCQNETYKTEDTKGGHKTGQTRESDFHFVWMQLSNLQCLKRNSSFLAPFSVCSFPSASLPIWKPFAGCCAQPYCTVARFHRKRAVYTPLSDERECARSLVFDWPWTVAQMNTAGDC